MAIGNLDADKNLEIIVINDDKMSIYFPDGILKTNILNVCPKDAEIKELRFWNISGVNPVVVVAANKFNPDNPKRKIGGYLYFYQFTGRGYQKTWESSKIVDEIIDIQVGDPKNEGKEGLIVMSRLNGKVKMTKISPH